ncbi:sensor histidine kinase [Streptomyces sp. WI04-05B]|uniref:sensor histidine kinase n=1 Tax=Streptomyces TaxID=1883 RepID=UPI00299F938F|nr:MULTISPECIES: histidine kinase [unclassified Streptomyces]MDX2540438.1 histidine kinase [Streptomyces sp. WI04-05B]MDX2585129.1 histidine kinase [Streptomyces sp. WI04-05A]MDX3749399.1 histidine kinase [Streptomyces sp. AK08-02]
MTSGPERDVPLWAEVPSAVLLALLSALEGFRLAGDTLADPAPWVAVLASFAALGRHRFPRAVAALALVSVALGSLLPLLVTLYHFASRGRLRAVWVCLGVAAGAGLPWLAVALASDRPLSWVRLQTWAGSGVGNAVLVALALALGMWAGSRRRLLGALRDQVEQLRVERELRAEQERSAERARIAREMHDVLAHRLSLLTLHAGVLQLREEGMSPAGLERLALLRDTAGRALDDLREVLGVLRSDRPAGAEGPAPVPAPAVRDLDELLAEARAAGQVIESVVSGDVENTSTGHRLAVHRLVREALTNARRHAHDAPVAVSVHYGPPVTTVEVVNGRAEHTGHAERTGRSPVTEGSATAGGYGLIGLAERVAALGGQLQTGASGGGWRLSARLPASAPASPPAPVP